MGNDPIKVARLPEDSIIEMARGIVLGERYVYPIKALTTGAPLFFIFIRFAPGEADNVGLVIGQQTKAVRSIDGYPCCMSGWLVHKDDVEAVQARVEAYNVALGEAGQDLES